MPQTSSHTTDCPGFVSALVLRCARGDRAALGTLVDLLYAPVAATVSGPRTAVDDDLVAQVFRDVWRTAPTFRREDNAVVWVLDLARATARRSRLAVAV